MGILRFAVLVFSEEFGNVQTDIQTDRQTDRGIYAINNVGSGHSIIDVKMCFIHPCFLCIYYFVHAGSGMT